MTMPTEHAGTPGRTALRPAWRAALIAGIVMLVVIAVTGAFTVLNDGPSSDTSGAPAPSVSAASTPSRTPAPPRPEPAAFDVAALNIPDIESVYTGMPRSQATWLTDLPGRAAVPKKERTPVWAAPDASRPPRLALAAQQYDYDARWLVLATKGDWVQILLPYGRGALPSSDAERVNGTAGWVRKNVVTLEREDRSVVIDLSDRAVTVDDGSGTTTIPAGIGAPATPTPRGISQVMTVTTASNTGLSLFLSAQSESLDTFAGVDYAATALHVGVGQGQEISNGCVRLTPQGLDLVKDLPAGVPVLVRD